MSISNDYLITEKPLRALIRFCAPMIAGNLFQQAYTIVDSAIVGHYNGETALAAVGASYSLTTIFICVAIGGGIGASVVISHHFGARRYGQMRSAISTAMLTFLGISVLLSAVGLLFSRQIMAALNTPADALEIAVRYLNVYFYGLPFLFMYNILSALFNALGKSRILFFAAECCAGLVPCGGAGGRCSWRCLRHVPCSGHRSGTVVPCILPGAPAV